MKITKLNLQGFTYHLLLPVLAVLAVASIGAYLTFQSSASTNCVSRNFRAGSSGPCVKYAQTMLNNVNYNVHNMGTQVWEYSVFGSALAVDGSYGRKTTAAVKSYQSFNNKWRGPYRLPQTLTVDGATGPRTWKSLCSAGKYINTHNDSGLMPNWSYFNSGYKAGVAAGCRSIVPGY